MQQPCKKAHDPLVSRRLEPIVADLDRRQRTVRLGNLLDNLSQKEKKSIHEVLSPMAALNNNSNKGIISNNNNNNDNNNGEWRLAAAPPKQSLPPQQQQVSYRVLMVDDSTMNRKMLGKLLRSVGHVCDEANDGDVAVAKVTPDCHQQLYHFPLISPCE